MKVETSPKTVVKGVTAADLKVKFDSVAKQIVLGTAKVGVLYLELCRLIRQEQLAPKTVRKWLQECGFHKTRISEINRVANAADAVWNRFAASTIGFRKVLEISRGCVVDVISEVNSLDKNVVVEGLQENDKQLECAVLNSDGDAGDVLADSKESSSSGDPAELAVRKFEKLSVSLLKIAVEMGFRSRQVRIGNGYLLRVHREKVIKGNKGDDGQNDLG